MACPLCTADDAKQTEAKGAFTRVRCLICGEFVITLEAAEDISKDPQFAAHGPGLSAATRRASEAGRPLQIDSTNWRKYAESFTSISPTTKATWFLEILRRRSRFFGDTVVFVTEFDWPLIAAQNSGEFEEILGHLHQTDRAKQIDRGGLWKLTWKGWQEVEPTAGAVRGLGFVAMAFDADMDDAYENGIRPAIESDCGLTAIRVDKQHFKEEITDRMIADIRRCEFLVADFTHQKNGVYFEAGFAMALGRLVIWCCRESDKDKLHFDTRQYPHLVWKDAADLREKLRDRLRALIPGARLS